MADGPGGEGEGQGRVVMSHSFGGSWTDEKLACLRAYLTQYLTALKNQSFAKIYVDAFAGTGYRDEPDSEVAPLFSDLLDGDGKQFIDGSARIALSEAEFSEYLFIDNNARHTAELEQLREEFPSRRITVRKAEANTEIRKFCRGSWRNRRAVVFLDPYGMQVEWETIAAIAATKAIDMWMLFPLGVAVNRLLRNDGQISASIRLRLDRMFGASDWFGAFYAIREGQSLSLFGEEEPDEIVRTADLQAIGDYFVSRLKTVFPAVAPNPKPLCNSKNVPLYLLCFAAANPKGGEIAVRIAQHILQ
jgi:three-Cys-motif partner protein